MIEEPDRAGQIGEKVGADKVPTISTSDKIDKIQKSGKPRRPGKNKSRMYQDLWSRPGYLVRRLHQIHIGLFADECGNVDLTPVQSAILTVLQGGEEMDQLTLSTSVGIDRTSGADVIRRLERRGLVTRHESSFDRRVKIVKITEQGKIYIAKVRPLVAKAQERLIAPLTDEERAEFYRLINKDASRAPMGTV